MGTTSWTDDGDYGAWEPWRCWRSTVETSDQFPSHDSIHERIICDTGHMVHGSVEDRSREGLDSPAPRVPVFRRMTHHRIWDPDHPLAPLRRSLRAFVLMFFRIRVHTYTSKSVHNSTRIWSLVERLIRFWTNLKVKHAYVYRESGDTTKN